MFRRIVRAGATKDERIAARSIFIPKDARPILEHTNGSALYVYEKAGGLYMINFWGASARPMEHYRYRTEDQRNEAILRFKSSVESSVERKVKARAEKAAWTNPLKVGDILYTSWGYDQTNVEFYAVTKVSGRRTWIREIVSDYEATGHMSGNTWPAMPIRFVDGKPETMHTAQPSGSRGVYIKISNCIDAWLHDGKVRNTTSYA
jgi:hypothetical protein